MADEFMERWLDEQGPMSVNLREMVRALMRGPWCMWSKESWRLELRCFDETGADILTIWRTPRGAMSGWQLDRLSGGPRGRSWDHLNAALVSRSPM